MFWRIPVFFKGTPILTPNGSRPIESFQVGDEILSRVEHAVNAPSRVSTVDAVFKLDATILEVGVGGQLIETTEKHPFFVHETGWVAAKDLQPGQLLVGHNGTLTTVDSVTLTERSVAVYNMRVASDHTYFVGANDWGFSVWVHNAYYVRKVSDDVWEVVTVSGEVKWTADTRTAAKEVAGRWNRRVLSEAVGTIGKPEVSHHVIPLEALDNDLQELMMRAERGGFDINAQLNGRALIPDNVPNRPTEHLGPHSKYNEAVIGALENIDVDARILSDVQIAERVQALSDAVGDAIDNGWLPIE